MAGLYIHIPFCHSKCAYCDFYSMPRTEDYSRYADALCRELDIRIPEIAEPISTIYLGGGTPSILDVASMQKITAAALSKARDMSEFTIEANPEDVTVGKVEAWRAMGINRVSMGVQSLDDQQLAVIGRRHTARQAINAVEAIRQGGIDNISLDLIYGLPGQSPASWLETLTRLLDLHPSHLSAYMLSYEPRTPLTAMLKTGKVTEATDDELVEMYGMLTQVMRDRGYNHYEVSNFALPGLEAKHNSNYWRGIPYLGLGPGAHSYDGTVRRVNPPNLKQYLSKIEAGDAAYEIDEETPDNRFNDMVMTALRTAAGLDLSLVDDERKAQLMRDGRPHIASGRLVLADNRLSISEPSWLVSDAIISDLMQV